MTEQGFIQSSRRVLLPVKRLEGAKLRLEALLQPVERAQLVMSMLADVVDAVGRAGFVPCVVSPDPTVLAWARSCGAAVFEERRSDDLNQSLEEAAASLLGDDEPLVVVLPDTPRATAAEIGALVARFESSGSQKRAVIVPDRWRTGSNALMVKPWKQFDLCFGEQSLKGHEAAAARAGFSLTRLESNGLSEDVDGVDDLRAVLRLGSGTRTRDYLMSIGAEARLTRAALG